MMLANSTKFFRRAIAAIAVVVFCMALAAMPALAQEPPCTPGVMVDFCSDVPPSLAFLLDKGDYTTFAFPGAVLTAIFRINNRGQMVGTYVDAGGGTPGGFTHGLLLADGVFTTIDHPDAVRETVLFGINSRDQILGGYVDAGGTRRSFLLERDVFTEFAIPGASRTAGFDLNDRGQVVGFYIDAVGPGHGFLLDGGTFTTIDIPDQSGPRPTQVVGINNSGEMVGVYITVEGIFQGFVMDKKGVITAINHPDTPALGRTGSPPFAQATPMRSRRLPEGLTIRSQQGG
jgi:uncharacterized membrane protein